MKKLSTILVGVAIIPFLIFYSCSSEETLPVACEEGAEDCDQETVSVEKEGGLGVGGIAGAAGGVALIGAVAGGSGGGSGSDSNKTGSAQGQVAKYIWERLHLISLQHLGNWYWLLHQQQMKLWCSEARWLSWWLD